MDSPRKNVARPSNMLLYPCILFFVISGFLRSKIILKKLYFTFEKKLKIIRLKKQKFSLRKIQYIFLCIIVKGNLLFTRPRISNLALRLIDTNCKRCRKNIQSSTRVSKFNVSKAVVHPLNYAILKS